MRPRSLPLLLLALASACASPPPTEPLPSGRAELHLALPAQPLVTDDHGSILRLQGVQLRLAGPACAPTACPLAQPTAQAFSLQPGEGRLWSTWSAFDAHSDSLLLSFAPAGASDATVLRLDGVLTLLGPEGEPGTIVFSASLAGLAPIRIPFPPGADSGGAGARYRLVLNPAEWLVDPRTGRAERLDRWVGPPLAEADPQRTRFVAHLSKSLRLERF